MEQPRSPFDAKCTQAIATTAERLLFANEDALMTTAETK
jgi:hypothetical protein